MRLEKTEQIRFLGYAMEPDRVGAIERGPIFYHSMVEFIRELHTKNKRMVNLYLHYIRCCGTEWLETIDQDDWEKLGEFASLYLRFLNQYTVTGEAEAVECLDSIDEECEPYIWLIYEALHDHELEAA